MRNERVGELLRAAAREYPSDQVRHRAENQTETGSQRTIERQHPMRGNAAEQRARPFLGKHAGGKALGRAQRMKAKGRQRKRVSRPCGRAERRALEARPVANDTAKQPPIRTAVTAE